MGCDNMKIAQISATFPPYMAGTGIVCFHNSLELAKLGHDVTVFTGTLSEDECEIPPELKVVRVKPLFAIGNAAFTPQLLKLDGFDIVHLHYPYYFGGELIYLLNKLKCQKYVITYHNDVVGIGLLKYFFDFHTATLMKSVLGNAARICAHTMDYAHNSNLKQFIEHENKIVEIPNGVDISHFHPSNSGEVVRNKYNLNDKKVILFVRALDDAHHHSGLEYLLNSVACIKDDDVMLLVVGDGNLKQYYIDVSKKLGISERVVFAGRLTHEFLPAYYAASDLVVLPSALTENFPLILLEAMASGKPVICSDLPGVRNIVDDGINGLLAKPRDVKDLQAKIEYILGSKDVRDTFGKNGRLKAEKKYSWDKIALQLEKVYREVLE